MEDAMIVLMLMAREACIEAALQSRTGLVRAGVTVSTAPPVKGSWADDFR
jgi:hypothetical protein